jgi:hypothetical protein
MGILTEFDRKNAYSGSNLPPVPVKTATYSGSKLPPIPAQNCH